MRGTNSYWRLKPIFKLSTKPYLSRGLLTGALAGLTVPLAGLAIDLIFALNINPLFHAYLFIVVPPILCAIGFFLGRQAERLETTMMMLEGQSMTDDVTGLYNHRHILEEIDREMERARRYRRIVSGMMIDTDSFKAVNDNYGHLTGDSILRELAKLLEENIRRVDIIGRFGGDEFVVILPETDAEAARAVAERLLAAVREREFKILRDYIKLSISVGLYTFKDTQDFERNIFIEKCDRAMFRAKEKGKNQIYVG